LYYSISRQPVVALDNPAAEIEVRVNFTPQHG
jgi:hypothetical protein